MRACDHLLDREGGKVFLDNTFVFKVLNKKPSELRRVIGRVDIYLKHDIVRIDSLHKHLIECVFVVSCHVYYRSSFQ
jgi:hypothetical protein